MTDITGLKAIRKSIQSEEPYEVHPQNPEPRRNDVVVPVAAATHDGWLPRKRGWMQPVLGQVGDPKALRALAASNRGWLHEDGRVLACGTFDFIDALRIVPELRGVFDFFDAEKEAVEARIDAEIAEFKILNGYGEDKFTPLGYLMDSQFLGDDQEYGYTDSIREKHPEPCPMADITRAGWTSLNLSRDRGGKVISAGEWGKDVGAVEGHLQTICQHFDCRLEPPVASKPITDASDNELPSDKTEVTTQGAMQSGEEGAYTNDNEPSFPTARF